jgi:hypothetical protein
MKKVIIGLLLLLGGIHHSYCQVLQANAGADQFICNLGGVVIGGSPAAINGTGPFSYSWSPSGGLSNTAIANPIANGTGTFTYILSVLDSFNMATVNDTVVITNNTSSANIIQFACSNQGYFFNGMLQFNTGLYFDTLVNSLGCDSLLALQLNVLPISNSLIFDTILIGNSTIFNNANINTAGVYYDTIIAANGCDSIISLQLAVILSPIANDDIVSNTLSSIKIFVLNNDYVPSGSNYYPPTLLFGASNGLVIPNSDSTFTYVPSTGFFGLDSFYYILCGIGNPIGCDTAKVVINVNSFVNFQLAIANDSAACNSLTMSLGTANVATGGTPPYNYLWFPSTGLSCTTCANPTLFATVSGTYILNVTDAIGAIRKDTIAITIYPIINTSLNANICNGSGYFFNNTILTSSGIYRDTLTSIHGCDSILTLNLLVFPVSQTTLNYSICSGQSILFDGQLLTTTGLYYDTLINVNGCDSIITLNLNVYNSSTKTIVKDICAGGAYLFNGQFLNVTGTYTDTLINANGCDSIISLFLAVKPLSANVISTTICTGNSFPFRGTLLSNSGTYSDTLINVNGCDSIVILQLLVAPPITKLVNAYFCFGSSIILNGQVINTPGIYHDTLVSYLGCDSFLTINLSVAAISFNTIFKKLCFGTTLLFNNQNISQAGLYRDTLVNYQGCDSFLQMVVSIAPLPSPAFTATYHSCFNRDSCATVIYTGSAVISYNWNFFGGQGNTTIPNPTICFLNAATHFISISVIDSNFCVASLLDSVKLDTNCVWPGDANADKIVNNLDIFSLGLGANFVGPIRLNASNVFIDQPAPVWPGSQGNTASWQHADCNGDGVINGLDSAAIVQNYFKLHAKPQGKPPPANDKMYLQLNKDTVINNGSVLGQISLGSNAIPIDSVYGVAFTFLYDLKAVDSNSIGVQLLPNFLFAGPSHYWHVIKTFKQQGQIDIGLVRHDFTEQSGFGDICNIQMDIVTDDLIGKPFKVNNYIFNCYLSAAYLVTLSGIPYPIQVFNDSLLILYTPNSVNTLVNKPMKLFPNPAQNQLHIQLSNNEVINNIEIYSTVGQHQKIDYTVINNNGVIGIQHLKAAQYIVKVNSKSGLNYYSKFNKL